MKNKNYRKYLIIGIIILFVGASIIPNVMSTKISMTYGSAVGGNVWIVDCDGGGNFTRIQEAIDNDSVQDGDTIYVCSGIYRENVTVYKRINLIGESKDNTTIDGNGTGITVDISADNVYLKGFTIQNSSNDGIYLHSDRTTISDNIIRWNTQDGISIVSGDNNNILNNVIENNRIAIFLWDSERNYIMLNDCKGSNNPDVYSLESGYNKIYCNNFNSGPFNIWNREWFYDSNKDSYFRNYWRRPRILPVFLLGRQGVLLFFNVDLFPAIEPYDLPRVAI